MTWFPVLPQVTDVVFQADPFFGSAAGVVFTGLEGEARLGDGSLVAYYNEKWMASLRSCRPEGTAAALKGKGIVCSGFSTGKAEPMLAYWRAMEDVLEGCNGQVVGLDQGAHQYLIHLRPPAGVAFEVFSQTPIACSRLAPTTSQSRSRLSLACRLRPSCCTSKTLPS